MLNSIGAVLLVVNALTMDDVIHKDAASRRDVIVIIVPKKVMCFVLCGGKTAIFHHLVSIFVVIVFDGIKSGSGVSSS